MVLLRTPMRCAPGAGANAARPRLLPLAAREPGRPAEFDPHQSAEGQARPARQRIRILMNRLKDKLGNRSNASAEVEFDRALAFAVGAEDRGIATILEMVQYTRLDCVIGSAGIIRAAFMSALHHARQRTTFGRRLVEHPLMANVLADVALESEAALLL